LLSAFHHISPVDGDEDHTEQRGGNIAVKEEWKEAT
jgi:hypothetical protein